MTKLDHVADVNGAELARLTKIHEFPPFVKSADYTRLMSNEGLPRSVYADQANQQFPCNSPAATWLSAAYFEEKRAMFSAKAQETIEARINEHADYHRIRPAVDAVRRTKQARVKQADAESPDEDYAYVWTGGGVKERHLPIRSGEEVKMAAAWLEEHCDTLPYANRHTIANKILEKAAAHNTRVSNTEFLERQAGRGVCNPAEVHSMLAGRLSQIKNPELKQQFKKIADCVLFNPAQALKRDLLPQLVTTIDTLDRQLGIKYSNFLPRPEEVIFRATFTKAANEVAAHVATNSGTVYEKAALARLPLSEVQSMFGTEFRDQVSNGLGVDPEKLAEEMATLPRGDAESMDILLANNGIRPALTKAASTGVGPTPEEYRQMARQYQTQH